MNKKSIIIMISMISTIGIILFVIIITLINVRSEFENYLVSKYPQTSFNVGKVGFYFINSNNCIYYNASVNCLNDDTKFSISREFYTKEITDNYMYQKINSEFNSKVNDILKEDDVLNDIISINGIKRLEDNGISFVAVVLKSDSDQIVDAKIILDILKENNIYADHVIFNYEKDNSVFQLDITPKDYNITEKELASMVVETKKYRLKKD